MNFSANAMGGGSHGQIVPISVKAGMRYITNSVDKGTTSYNPTARFIPLE